MFQLKTSEVHIWECQNNRDLKEALVEVKENSKYVFDDTLSPKKILVDIDYLFVLNMFAICLRM